jgi:hypothetical protein
MGGDKGKYQYKVQVFLKMIQLSIMWNDPKAIMMSFIAIAIET